MTLSFTKIEAIFSNLYTDLNTNLKIFMVKRIILSFNMLYIYTTECKEISRNVEISMHVHNINQFL